jgi:endonuclease G
MKTITTILALFLSTTLFANPIDDNCPDHAHPLGAPVSTITQSQYVCHLNYAVHFRYDTKVAEYVTYRIDPEDISGTAKRKDNFRDDPSIPSEHDVTLADYAGKPYDRGHLSPAADNTASEEQMSQSFYLSNMVPQNPNQNRGAWRILEDRIRNIAKEGRILYVTVGTVYRPGYEVIGNGLGVPQYIWKVVVDAETNNSIAFLFENKPIRTQDIHTTITTISAIEKMTGLNFHPDSTSVEFEEAGPDMIFWEGI